MDMRLDIALLSRVGARERNEDAVGVWSDRGVSYCVLADGAGGLGGGDRASQLAVACVLDYLRASPECTHENLYAALRDANDRVVAAQREDERCSDMRTTVVVLALDTVAGRAIWGHAGDARLYCFRDGAVIVQTTDHSVVQQMVEAGYLRAEELRQAPQRNQLTLALGDAGEFEPEVAAGTFVVHPGDSFLLCTDGCWGPVEESEMVADLLASRGAGDWLERMQSRIVELQRSNQDNYSAIAVCCEGLEEPVTLFD